MQQECTYFRNHIIVEGIDSTGKSSLIRNIMNTLDYFLTVHYQKPLDLDSFNKSLKQYQMSSFWSGFQLFKTKVNTIYDRFHLGEVVYSNRYRDYDGDYVFELEKNERVDLNDDVVLILLYTSNFSICVDDGESFDFSKKEEEQSDFIEAFNKSIISNKIMIDVSSIYGGFKHPDDILYEAMKAICVC
jgi:thymidylate kinase